MDAWGKTVPGTQLCITVHLSYGGMSVGSYRYTHGWDPESVHPWLTHFLTNIAKWITIWAWLSSHPINWPHMPLPHRSVVHTTSFTVLMLPEATSMKMNLLNLKPNKTHMLTTALPENIKVKAWKEEYFNITFSLCQGFMDLKNWVKTPDHNRSDFFVVVYHFCSLNVSED